ncbi:MAG: DUF4945 domain-containing protein [Tannerella sp.]|jgi:hypothetical protein|nr:DUF4945 domain-containing protein [Tannerella sp.]
MKKRVYIFMLLTWVCLCIPSCYDRNILDSKEGVSLPPVTGLEYTRSGDQVTLTWGIPSDIPPEISRPLSVNVQVLRYRPGVLSITRVDTHTLSGEPLTASLTVPNEDNAGYEYHIVVKLTGHLKESVYGYSSQIFSLGQTIIIE